jgi:hypothetical protein
MQNRSTSYVSRPSESFINNKDALDNNKFFLVARIGPTVFNIQDEDGKAFRVAVGNPHTCSCHQIQCIHQVFCLLKVLRIPSEHALSWQTSFTDIETNQVLDGITADKRKRMTKKVNDNVQTAEASTSNRQGFSDGEEICPVCQDEMSNFQALTWCRKGCGNNFHAKCLQSYANYKISNKDKVCCPLCRADWAIELLKDDCRGKSVLKHSCALVKCHACTLQVKDCHYRCLECSQASYIKKAGPIDLCQRCYTAHSLPREHINHHFVSSNASTKTVEDIVWTSSINPRAPAKLLDSDILQSLQNRELSEQDYEMLRQLDESGPPELSEHLIDCFERVNRHSFTMSRRSDDDQFCKCFCQEFINQAVVDERDVRRLFCGHLVHSDCLKTKILQVLSEEGSGRLLDEICLHRHCNKRIFGGLNRRRKKSNKSEKLGVPKPASAEQAETDASTVITRENNSLLTVSGYASLTRNDSTSSNNGMRQQPREVQLREYAQESNHTLFVGDSNFPLTSGKEQLVQY